MDPGPATPLLLANGSAVSDANPFPVKGMSGGTGAAAAGIANYQITADTTAGGVVLAAARATRRSVTIVNLGLTDVYLGAGTVTAANGFLLAGVRGAAVTLDTTAAVKGVTAAGSQAVSVLEIYD
jgi:hypothetical protein